jgi:drug/metabolite transporter superfamily protein YnfA
LVESSWRLAHPMSLIELALLDGRRPLPLWDVIGLIIAKCGIAVLSER